MSLPVPAKAGPFGRLARFLLVGMGNTLVSLAIIAALLASGTGPFTANAAGFACGFAMSFVLNRRFTFGMRGRARLFEVLPFAACMAAAYIVNLAVLGLFVDGLGDGLGEAFLYEVCDLVLESIRLDGVDSRPV